jgi:hypothetical protein
LAFGPELDDNSLTSFKGESIMVNPTRALVEKQIRRVRVRLFVHVAVQSLVLCGAIGFFVTMLWFLVRPFAFADFGDTVRWGVPAAMLGISTLAGLVLAWMRRPSRVTSALALDERFGLKERVTTFLTLAPEHLDTPAGQALLKDVNAHLSALQMTGAFPLRLSWQQMLMPTAAFALALLACVLDPLLSDLKFSTPLHAESPRQTIDTKEIQQQLDTLKKNLKDRNQEQQDKSDQLKEMEKEFEKLLNQPLDMKNEEKIRERINEMRELKDKMKERMDGLKDKNAKTDAMKKQLEKLGLNKEKLATDGHAKDFEDALRNGDLDKAKTALQELIKDLKNEKLNANQQKELADQFKRLQKELQKLKDNDEYLKKLKKDLKDGKITKEDLQREMENFKNLQDLTDILGECQECLGSSNSKAASDKVDKLLKRFGEIDLSDTEIAELLRDQAEIDAALNLLSEATGEGFGNEMGEAGARRPIDPNDPNSKITPERSRAKVDAKGEQRVTGYARGGTFNKIPAKSVEGAFRQAVQDAPEAMDRQRIPDDAAAITRGYFNKLGNQK